MFQYRVTKYNPKFRNKYGNYLKDEWTDFTDIGKKFVNRKLTYKDYLSIENKYINAILNFMECLDINSLQIQKLEKHLEPDSDKFKKIYDQLRNNLVIKKEDIPEIISLILRNYIWCTLLKKNKMFVHFGYDYYMYIGSSLLCEKIIKKIEDTGLFVEEFKSPYL